MTNFVGPAVAVSTAPEVDGYHVTLNGLPYHVHPTATPPDEWAELEAAIVAGEIETQPYSAPAKSAAELWADRQDQAKVALTKSDLTAIRCFKSGVAFPDAWKTYVADLRAIVAAESGDSTQPLPEQPSYPAGT